MEFQPYYVADGAEYEVSLLFRKCALKVNGYEVRARTGYYFDETTLDPAATAATEIDAALTSPLDYTGLPVRLKIRASTAAKLESIANVPNSVTVDASDRNHLSLVFAYDVRTTAGDDVVHQGTTLNLYLTAEELQRLSTTGVAYTQSVELKPGTYVLRVVARDALSGRMGSVLGSVVLR